MREECVTNEGNLSFKLKREIDTLCPSKRHRLGTVHYYNQTKSSGEQACLRPDPLSRLFRNTVSDRRPNNQRAHLRVQRETIGANLEAESSERAGYTLKLAKVIRRIWEKRLRASTR